MTMPILVSPAAKTAACLTLFQPGEHQTVPSGSAQFTPRKYAHPHRTVIPMLRLLIPPPVLNVACVKPSVLSVRGYPPAPDSADLGAARSEPATRRAPPAAAPTPVSGCASGTPHRREAPHVASIPRYEATGAQASLCSGMTPGQQGLRLGAPQQRAWPRPPLRSRILTLMSDALSPQMNVGLTTMTSTDAAPDADGEVTSVEATIPTPPS